MVAFFRTVFLLALGVAGGFVAAHFVNQTPSGRAFFANLDAKMRDFGEGVSDGYRRREAELRGRIG